MQAINFFVSFAVLLLLKSSSGATLNDESQEITPIEQPSEIKNDIAKEYSEEIPLEDIGVNTLWARPRVIRRVEAPEEENMPSIPENSKDGLEYIPLEVLLDESM